MSLYYRVENNSIIISGQTYTHKEQIKSFGARFNGQNKSWVIPFDEKTLEEIDSFVKNLGGKKLQTLSQDTTNIPSAILKTKTEISPARTAQNKIKKSLSIKELMDQAFQAINQKFSHPIWIIGEVQNLSHSAKGIYLSLAEGEETKSHAQSVSINATIWQNYYLLMQRKHGKEKLAEILSDSMKVRFLCQVSLYKGRGSLSLSIQDIDIDFTKGALALAREKLIKELQLKNLYHANKQHKLTPFPFKVGLISSEGSRAESDFLNQLWQGRFPGHVIYAGSAMQGEATLKSVPKALSQLIAKNCDIIVLTRGGGSRSDLRWFDSTEIAYAIAQSPTPIISAIGHHDDESVAELVSFKREKTPTAAAEFVLNIFRESLGQIELLTERFTHSVSKTLNYHAEKTNRLTEKINYLAEKSLTHKTQIINHYENSLERSFFNRYDSLRRLFMGLQHKIQHFTQQRINREELRLNHLDKKIISLDPTPWLKQGWTQLYSKKKQVSSIQNVNINDTITARLLDGTLHLKVENKKGKNTHD